MKGAYFEASACLDFRLGGSSHVALRIEANYVQEADHLWWGTGVFVVVVT